MSNDKPRNKFFRSGEPTAKTQIIAFGPAVPWEKSVEDIVAAIKRTGGDLDCFALMLRLSAMMYSCRAEPANATKEQFQHFAGRAWDACEKDEVLNE